MLRATFRSLLARKLRLLLSALAIVLGVSFVSGAFVLTDSLGKVFDDLFSSVNRNVAVDVLPGTGAEDDDAQGRVLPASLVAELRRVDGAAEVAGLVGGQAQLVGKDNKLVGSGAAPTFGFNWVDSVLQTATIAEGAPPRGPTQIAVNRTLAERAGYRVGDRAPVLTDAPLATYTIVGIVEYDGKGSLGGSSNVFFDTATAQRVLGTPDSFSEIALSARDGVSQEELRDRVAEVLPAGTRAVTGEQLALDQASDVKQGLGFFNTFLLVFAVVALFVGGFIIFNTFSMLVAQRTRELALMRALGASRGQVNRAVLLEALVVGLLSSVLGLAAGVGVALGLTALFGAFGAELPEGPTVIAPRTVVAAFLVGTLVTALAALLPARRAGRVPPIAALREAATPDRSLTRQTIAGLVLLAVGALVMARALAEGGLPLLGVGTVLTFLGVAMVSPVVSRPVSSAIGRLFSRRLPGRLGKDNAVRNPRRTAATAAALMVGVALISAVTVLGSSLKASVEVIAGQALGADFVLAVQGPGFPDEVVAELADQPGVGAVAGLKGGVARIDGEQQRLSAVPPSAVGDLVTLSVLTGSERLPSNGILLSQDEAEAAGAEVGDVLQVALPRGGTTPLTVTGTYANNELVGGFLVSDAVAGGFSSQRNVAALIDAARGADLAQVRQALEAQVSAYPNITVQDRSEFVAATADEIEQVVTIINILLGFSVLIALLGVLNTLALSVLERTRELGLLRAVGMSRRQVKRMVRVESVIICTFGGLLGLAVGTAFGAALQHALEGEGVTELGVPVRTLLVYLLLAAVAGVLAAWLPARRASRLDVLGAIATA